MVNPTVKILRKASKFVARGWNRGQYGRIGRTALCTAEIARLGKTSGCRVCALGALYVATGLEVDHGPVRAALDMALVARGCQPNLVVFNDYVARSKHDVLKLFKEAERFAG